MSKLAHLEPQNVFHFFEELCNIPHGSGNTEGITAYLLQFAQERGLEARRDELGNVIIRKPAAPGYEEVPGIVIQGHTDMVAVKTPDSKKDMTREGLDLEVDGDYVYAINTSLGGDDGIAIAYGLAILDAADLSHPEIELVATVDEETGLFGAKAIDLSDLKGRRFLNLDSEEEGIFLTSCAGGIRLESTLPMNMVSVNGKKVTVAVKGLQGGHSGADIHKERGNALYLLARVLYRASKDVPFYIASFNGGTVENAIPREAVAELVLMDESAQVCQDGILTGQKACTENSSYANEAGTSSMEEFEAIIRNLEKELQTEYAVRDAGLFVECVEGTEDAYAVYDKESTDKLLQMLIALPVGVQAMSQDVPGLVETSLNLGVVTSDDTKVVVQHSVRSSLESAKWALVDRLEAVFCMVGASYSTSGEYPGWAYRADSPLREKLVRIYEEMFGKKPEIQAIHAGLECGLFLGKVPDLDCVSLGPDMCSIHTTEERLSISSTKRVWEFLVQVLADKM